MKNVARIQLSFLFIFFALLAVNAQMINIPFDIDNWEIQDEQKPVFEEYMGKESISFSKGVILAKEVNFLNGIIEVDINFPEKRGFPGLVFRVEDLSNYEEFYIRPHQSGNPDANQYTPVFNGLAGWQLYYGEGHSKAIAYEFGAWNHLKIEIKGQKAFVYLNDMEKPLLEIPELKRDLKAGKIGLKAFMAPVHFANLRYQKTHATTSAEAIKKADGENQNEVRNWNVSDAFSVEDFDNDVFLPEKFTADLNWKTVKSETSGLINFARFCQYSRA
ncbi:MAG: DUF1080 domain-containing protein, partial [Bacteroidetes bacterium]|nr:DUF1080 domain-containing protein [Bacteroidota bacterium]